MAVTMMIRDSTAAAGLGIIAQSSLILGLDHFIRRRKVLQPTRPNCGLII